MTDLESDLKRMVQNAKDYNSSKSEVFEDAERIRKALSNFMPKHNPAYQDPEYRAIPTPAPEHVSKSAKRDTSVSGSEPSTIRLKLNTGGRPRSTAPSEPVDNGPVDESLQQTWLETLDELSSLDDAPNFEEKPPRKEYPDYYKVIKQPTSIHEVRKMVDKGKIRSWDDLAREVRLIWQNAKEYNDPESFIYQITEKLEVWCETKLQAYGVAPKIVPRLSLKTSQPPNIKLKMGTPVAPTPNGNQYHVDQAALDRQKAAMTSALNRARDTSEAVSMPAVRAESSLRRSVSIADLNRPMSGMNGHASTPIEPSKPAIPADPAHLPTPTLEGVPPQQPQESKPTLALQSTVVPLANGYHAPTLPQQASNLFAESTNPIDRKHRDLSKSASDALLQSITYMTNPLMLSDPKWRLTRQAHPARTQTSYYTYLPPTHSSIRIIPCLHLDLQSRRRKYKLFVLNNNAILPASPDVSVDQAMGGQTGPAYDCHLVPGENVVVVEAISSLKEGERKEYAKDWEQFDFEKVTFYIYLRPKVL